MPRELTRAHRRTRAAARAMASEAGAGQSSARTRCGRIAWWSGVRRDIAARAPLYLDDLYEARNVKARPSCHA